MPAAKEFAVRMEDLPGTLGKACRALADRRINILALQSFPSGGENLVRFVADNPITTRRVLDGQDLAYTEEQVVQAKLRNRPGELARAAAQLGEANINIDYAYCGVEPGTGASLMIFGVSDVDRAVAILDQAAVAAVSN